MATIRIDKLLWFLRLAKTRGLAQHWVAAGHIRVNQRRAERASLGVGPGDVLVLPLPLPQGVLVIELVQIPLRRGPASEARSCYRVLDAAPANPIAAAAIDHAKEGDPQP